MERHLDEWKVSQKFGFAIQHVGDNKYEMGTKAVGIDENSVIIVDGVKYDGTT